MIASPRLSSITFLGFQVNAAIDEGHADKFSFDDIYDGLERGTLLQDLSNRVPGEFDLELLNAAGETPKLLGILNDAAEALRGRERRKTGVENSGLALLQAIILEAIQQRNWTVPQPGLFESWLSGASPASVH
jgi:hypothetical protein